MPTDQPKRSVWPTIFAGVVLLAVSYCAAYLSLMEAKVRWRATKVAEYPHPVMAPFFAPMEWLDRRIRPQFWEP